MISNTMVAPKPMNRLYLIENLAKQALHTITLALNVSRTIQKHPLADFGSGKGIERRYRIPGFAQVHERELYSTEEYLKDKITEGYMTLKLDKTLYSQVPFSADEVQYDVENISRQILFPQITEVVQTVEQYVIDGMMKEAMELDYEWSEDKPVDSFFDVFNEFQKWNFPMTNIYCVMGRQIVLMLLKAKILQQVNTSGSSDVLRRSTFGNLAGFNIIMSNRIPKNAALFYSRDSFVFASRGKTIIPGTEYGKSMSNNEFALTYKQNYDFDHDFYNSRIETEVGINGLPVITRNPYNTLDFKLVVPAFKIFAKDIPEKGGKEKPIKHSPPEKSNPKVPNKTPIKS